MRIMEVNSTMNVGGIETFLMNIIRNINLKKYEFVFLTYRNFKFDYEDELNEFGCKIIRIKHPKEIKMLRNIKHIKNLYHAIKNEKVDVVHTHTYFDSAFVLFAAKIAGVKIRIVHSHTSWALDEKNKFKKIKHFFGRIFINKFSTDRLACSELAGKALYGNNSKFSIIPNGIDFEKFYFDEKNRKKIRKELNIKENEIVIGHVGRIDTPKNHSFLIKIFQDIISINNTYKLVLVGEGPLLEEIKKECKDIENIIFLGNRKDVNLLLNAFDIFVFPSIYEGLPISLVEAQANGLPIIASSNISNEIKLTKALEFYGLDKSSKEWSIKILNRNKERINTKSDLLKSDYSIFQTIKKIEKIFKK